MRTQILFFILRHFYGLSIAYDILLDNIKMLCPNKKLLVIGMARSGLFQGIIPKLAWEGIKPDVVELNPDNAEWIKKSHELTVFNVNATEFDKYDDYDTVIWIEGPEHVTKEEFDIVNKKIKKSNFIVECPIGFAEEDTGELGMKHISGWVPEELNKRDFKVLFSDKLYAPNRLPLMCGINLQGVVR